VAATRETFTTNKSHRLAGYSGGSCSSILPCSFCRTTRGNLQTFTSASSLQPFDMREDTAITSDTHSHIFHHDCEANLKTNVIINLLTISCGSCGGFGTTLAPSSKPPPAVDCIPNLNRHTLNVNHSKNNSCLEGRQPLFQLLGPCGFGTWRVVSARHG
jgi:hypothetical protein